MSEDPSCTTVLPLVETLLVKAQQGDNTLWAQVNHNTHTAIMKSARKRCFERGIDADYAEDISQTTFMMLMDPSYARFDPKRGSINKYLAGLTHNAAKIASVVPNEWSATGGFTAAEFDSLIRPETHESDMGSPLSNNPESIVESAELQKLTVDLANEILDDSDETTQQVAMRTFHNEESYTDVAADLGIHRTTVMRRHGSYLEKLEEKLKAEVAA